MPAHKAGTARVSSTVTKRNPRPRKYASASERQAAYRARAPEVCFRAEAKTVQTLDSIAETLDQPRADLLLSMTKFALANHDWARFGMTHRPLPYGYGLAEQEFIGPRQANPQPIWKRTRPKSLGKPVPLTPKQKAAAKKRAAAAGRKYPNLVDNIAAARMENPTMKADKWKRDKLRGTYTRGGYVIYKIGLPTSLNRGWYVESPDGQMIAAPDYLEEAKRIVDQAIEGVDIRKVNPMKKPTPAQLAARARFAEMARSGAFKRKAKKAKANPAKKTVSQKISQLTREGYPQKQAIAIALSEQRAGKVKANPARRGRAPSIQVGDYVRSYDFPGMHDDHYLEGVVTAIGNGVYSIAVSRRVVGGEEKSIPEALRQVRAPMGPHFMTGVYGVQKLTRKTNPRASNPAKFTASQLASLRDHYSMIETIDPSSDSYIKLTAKLDAMSLPVLKQLADARIKWISALARNRVTRMERKTNPATGQKKSGTKLNPKPRMAKIAWLTPGGQREVMEVPIDFAFKEYIGNIQEDFFARTDDGFLVVTEKSTGMKVGQVPHTMRAAALNDRAAAKRFVQSIVEKVGAPGFRAAIAKHPRIA